MLPLAKDHPDIYPGIALRFLAVCIDFLLVSGLVTAFVFTAGVLDPTMDDPLASGFVTRSFLLLAWVYAALFEGSPMQGTPGKWLLGMQVTDGEGSRIAFWRAAWRSAAKFISWCILLLGFLMAEFTPRRQALHDYAAGTFVVRRKAFVNWLSAPPDEKSESASSDTRRWRRPTVGQIVILSVVLLFAWYCYRMISNSNDLRNFCGTLKPGMSRAQMQAAVDSVHYQAKFYKDAQYDSALISIPGTYPPNQCVVDFSGDQVQSTHYSPFD